MTMTNFHLRYTRLGQFLSGIVQIDFRYARIPIIKYIARYDFQINTLLQSPTLFFYLLQEIAYNTNHNALHEASKYESVVVRSN